jgi:DNA-binding CsgD family transcriptional regulator
VGIVMWYDAVLPQRQMAAARKTVASTTSKPGMRTPSPVMLHEEPTSAGLPPGSVPAQPSLLASLLAAESITERRRAVSTLVHSLGFEWLGYGRLIQLGTHAVPLSFCTTYADRRWAERYFGEGYHEEDPRLSVALRSSLPAVWCIDQLAAQAAGSVAESRLRRFVAELAETGMRSGVLFALPAASGPERHFISLLSRTPGAAWMGDGLLGQVLTLSLCLHEFYTRYAGAPQAAEAPAAQQPKLTPIQRDILVCVSLGMGDKEIAARLNLTLHNVDYHMRQLRRRFAVRNRVQLMQAAQNLDI